MEKTLRLYTYVDGGINDTPFPSSEDPIEIGAFRYDAKRMGGAPTITASVMYPTCLDDEWTDTVYAEFNGEKYYLKQTPTSSYSNEDERYKHDLELVSERRILDDVYFFDTVTGDPAESDKPVSNSTKVTFFGDVWEFANRLQSSLEYSGVGYKVVVDVGVESKEKLVSFEDQFFSNVLQEIYNTYELPYYVEGKTIHIGYSVAESLPTFAYGVDDALLSITKNNANYKIVNRATATGSSDNIPFYYPNNSPKGNIDARTNREGIDATILDYEKYSNEINLDQSVKYIVTNVEVSSFTGSDGGNVPISGYTKAVECDYKGYTDEYSISIHANKESSVKLTINPFANLGKVNDDGTMTEGAIPTYSMRLFANGKQVGSTIEGEDTNRTFDFKVGAGTTTYTLYIKYSFDYTPKKIYGQIGLTSYSMSNDSTSGWYLGEKEIELSKVGLKVSGIPQGGDTITQKLIEYIKTSNVLMPYKYRETKGDERFYNAINGTYEGITFNNPYVAGKPKEHIFKVEDLKPSIEGMEVNGQRIDMFADFAYDEGDNDETYEDEEGNVYYKYPYFFAKLKPLGFNLFEHAIEQQPMTISFTSGDCGACSFEIAVDEETQKNTVQVDANGNVKRDSNGRVLCGAEGSGQGDIQPQDEQQDTTSHSVWIALRKEDATYGILMPKAPVNGKGGHRPSTSDKFVILGIKLPSAYIVNAEKRLEAEIINYLKNNNDEKFTFSINFSRIYFAENAEVLNNLNENSKVTIVYDGKEYELYVSSFSYTMSEGEVLPEIKVELDETLKISQNALQNAINEIKSTLGNAINIVSQEASRSQRNFVSKVENDIAMGEINFSKGIKFGEGGKVEVLDNNSAKLTIEYLEVTKKATFTSLEIQEKTHVGGQLLVTPASINCGEVEELDNAYRCYFQTKGAEGGDEIFNQFAVGDQAISQTFNEWGSKYYWRLVVGVGDDYIDLSKTDCDEGSDVPSEGDKIIQLGNREDESRQNAIVISAHGDNSPSIIQYKGINSFELPKEKVTTMLSPTENILTGQVTMTAGSKGLELFDEWAEKQAQIDAKVSQEDLEAFQGVIDKDLENLQNQIDGAIETWFYDPTPTLNNLPASEWTTNDDKNNHLGDLYYSGAGKAYRFQYEDSKGYYWNEIADEDIAKALENAKKAQDTADGKRRVFYAQPTTPYDKGDLWSQGKNAPMKICVNSRSEGSYNANDWDFADNNSALATEIAGYEYIKDAIQNGNTIVTGGLVQSGILMLGYNDANGAYHVMSGTNGIYKPTETGGGIAAWWGGEMSEDLAKAVIRFDGSGFFANKNISWDNEGGVSFANGKLTITPQGALVLNDSISFGSGQTNTVGQIISDLSKVLSYFDIVDGELVTTYTLRVKKNLVVEGDSASGGDGQYTPAIGTVTGVSVNGVKYTDVVAGILDLSGAFNGMSVDLSGYYTKQEVDGKITGLNIGQYATATALNAVSDRVSTLESAGYATQGYVNTQIANLINGAPTTLDTLKEIADALADNEDVVDALEAAIGTKANASDLTALTTRVSTAEANISNLTNNKANKATTIAGYGITDAYTKTEVGEMVSTINSSITAVSGRVTTLESWRTDISEYITIVDGNVKIATNLIVTGDATSGGQGSGSSSITGYLDNLLDVSVPTPSANDILRFNGTEWVNIPQSLVLADYYTKDEIDDIVDGIGTGGVSGDYLPLTGGTITGNLTLNGELLGNAIGIETLSWITINPTLSIYNKSNYAYVTALTVNSNGFTIQPRQEGVKYLNTILNNIGGNVGIGTTNPAYKLDVAGDVHIKNGSVRNPLTIDTNGVGAYMNFAANGTIYGYVGVNTTEQLGFLEYINGSTVNGIYVSPTSIGLGTSSPKLGKKVQINSSTWDGFLALNRTVAGGGASISCYANGSHLGNFGIDGSGYFEVNGNNSTTNFWVNANNGQTAIGYTAHPNFCQFDVNGSGRFATKVLTPDYITQAAHYVNISSVGWYRIAVADNSITGLNAIVSIRRAYYNTNNEAYVFSISCAYSGQTTITQISGHINYKLISKIRVVNPSSGTKAIDIYYNGTALNTVYVNCIGDFKSQTPASVAASQSGVTELSISSSGMATTGNLVVSGDVASGGSGTSGLSWSGITNTIVNTNEFNFVDATSYNRIWFNYRSKSGGYATVPTYVMGNGAGGYATVLASAFTQSSDMRMKNVVEDKIISLELIANAPLFSFKWNNGMDNKLHLGTSAQYWEGVTPQLVMEMDTKTLDYATLGVAMGISLARVIKELKAEIAELKEQLKQVS